MKRHLYDKLVAWKNRPGRKPLLIEGARQVGKTWLMKNMGETQFDKTVYLPCERPETRAIFLQCGADVRRMLDALTIREGRPLDPARTLIVIDEIQEIPEALASLKYWCEDAPEYAVMAAGSFLGVSQHRGTGFPVGKVDILRLEPLSFSEYLEAVGEGGFAQAIARGQWDALAPFTAKLTDELRRYFYIGGMPEVVAAFARSSDFEEVRRLQESLLEHFRIDFSKHIAPADIPRVGLVWDSIPAHLSREKKKFIFRDLKPGARAASYEAALWWLESSGLIRRVRRVETVQLPLAGFVDAGAFKIYGLDVGLLAAQCRLPRQALLDGDAVFASYKGALTEQFVCQELAAAGIDKTYYWRDAGGRFEVDFIFERDARIFAAEVKAGTSVGSRSFSHFLDRHETQVHGLRYSLLPYRAEARLVNLPLWAAAAGGASTPEP